jgi:hypothetical protein
MKLELSNSDSANNRKSEVVDIVKTIPWFLVQCPYRRQGAIKELPVSRYPHLAGIRCGLTVRNMITLGQENRIKLLLIVQVETSYASSL